MAPAHHQMAKNGVADEVIPAAQGPHPGNVNLGQQYTFEKSIRRLLREQNSNPAREDTNRLDGIALIGQIREALQLPVKTFDTACTFYHTFRLSHRESEYNWHDAAIACLFFACKSEDTLKKSKEILCAAYNVQHPGDSRSPDDKMFEKPSTVIIGLERMIVESIAFDFRVRHPQKVLSKILKAALPGEDGKRLFSTAWKMSLDMYLTFVPIKQTTFTMAFATVELTSRLTGQYANEIRALDPEAWHTTRECVMETMLDMLDLYTENHKLTKIGKLIDPSKFIETKIAINRELDAAKFARFQQNCHRCETDPIGPTVTSPTTSSHNGRSSSKRGREQESGTNRFVFDADEAHREDETVQSYFKDQYEEYEVEVEEEIPMPPRERPREHRGHGHGHGHGHGRDSGWYGGRGGRQDRRRGRGGFH